MGNVVLESVPHTEGTKVFFQPIFTLEKREFQAADGEKK